MAKALKCDRCGQFCDLITVFRTYRIQKSVNPVKYLDLCPNCYNKLCDFLEEIKNQDLIGEDLE